MDSEALVKDWFTKWTEGRYRDLPISDDFKHHSPYGTIVGKQEYLELVAKNEEQFLGHRFEIHEGLYADDKACLRYTTRRGDDFALTVSEWYHFRGKQIAEIYAYYHIGEIREAEELQ